MKYSFRLAVLFPALIFSSCFLISLTPVFSLHKDALSMAMLGDLLITAPLVYFLLIRKTNISKLTVLRVFIIGLLFAGWIISRDTNPALHFIKKWIAPLAELTVILFVIKKFYAANKTAKLNSTNADFLLTCRSMMHQVTGNEKAGNIIASEIAVFYYAFIGRKDKQIDYQIKFSSYKENGILTVLFAILFLLLIETCGMHFLFAMWSNTAAWILTALSVYTCLQLFAHIRSVKARPVLIGKNFFHIRNGLAGDAVIDLNNVAAIEISKKIPAGDHIQKISLLKGLENHNIVIRLKNPINVTKIFGIKKRAETVLFFVDQPELFLRKINGFRDSDKLQTKH